MRRGSGPLVAGHVEVSASEASARSKNRFRAPVGHAMEPMAICKRVVRLLLARTAQADRVLTRLSEGLEVAELVNEPWRYTIDHVRRRPIGVYTLREGCEWVCLRHRHGGADPLTLEEVIGRGAYRLPAEIEARVAEHGGAIIDLGGNIGLAALWFSRRYPGQRIVTFEPDLANASVLERVARLNGLDWRIEHAAASNRDGEMRFQDGLEWESRIDKNGSIFVPAVDLFSRLDGAALLKMDIEGGEWDILTDPRFKQVTVPVIVLEHHAHRCPAHPRHARPLAIDALESAGYTVHLGDEYELGKGILWGVQSDARPA